MRRKETVGTPLYKGGSCVFKILSNRGGCYSCSHKKGRVVKIEDCFKKECISSLTLTLPISPAPISQLKKPLPHGVSLVLLELFYFLSEIEIFACNALFLSCYTFLAQFFLISYGKIVP